MFSTIQLKQHFSLLLLLPCFFASPAITAAATKNPKKVGNESKHLISRILDATARHLTLKDLNEDPFLKISIRKVRTKATSKELAALTSGYNSSATDARPLLTAIQRDFLLGKFQKKS